MIRRISRLNISLLFLLIGAVMAFGGERAVAEDDIDNPAVLALLRGLPELQVVTLPWRPGRFTQFQIGTAEEGHVTARGGSLSGHLYPVPQSGPAPYAVLLSGCGGTYNGINGLWLKLWARYLQDIGVGALTLDSFDARGVSDGVCGNGAPGWAQRRIDDAHAALAWLASQPGVDAHRVIVMGMSNGARAAVLSVSARENWRLHRFAAAVALYPACDRMPPHDLLAPSLLLLGEADEGAAPAVCTAFAQRRHASAFPPRVTVYPKAYHLFDVSPRDDNYGVPEVVQSRADALAFLRQVLERADPAVQWTAAPTR